uniref:Uncharacterized protein n=1 Tax=Caloglossa intermedia TaxID=100879 RepID=A0A1Z1M5Z3_9FLOR|nr:hypothetical protein [Caloglossa intermedia]ARW61426.1 hypothetical protein [Caloglossa intermedia]
MTFLEKTREKNQIKKFTHFFIYESIVKNFVFFNPYKRSLQKVFLFAYIKFEWFLV